MNKIRLYRERRDLSQSELAIIMGVNRTAVAKWETGVCNPHTDRLIKFAKILRCSVDDLLDIGKKK